MQLVNLITSEDPNTKNDNLLIESSKCKNNQIQLINLMTEDLDTGIITYS